MANEMGQAEFLYNPNLKNKLLENYSVWFKRDIRGLFNKIESVLGKDILQCGKNEAMPALVATNEYSPERIRMCIYWANKYIDLGRALGEPVCYPNGFKRITDLDVPLTKQVRANFILSPKQLYDYIFQRYHFDWRGVQQSVGLRYEIPAVVMYWSGVSDPEKVLQAEVDLTLHTVAGYPISDILWPLIEQYNENKFIFIENECKDITVSVNTFLFHAPWKDKRVPKSVISSTLKQALKDRFYDKGSLFTPSTIVRSGRYYRAYEAGKNRDLTSEEVKYYLHFHLDDMVDDKFRILRAYKSLARQYEEGTLL